MREAADPLTGERRDLLAQDWPRFLAAALPDIAWCPIPNIGTDAVDYASRWQIDAICLTGGDDVGEHTPRDKTEHALLQHCFAHGIPTLGICRGLQRIWVELGGTLGTISHHAGSAHEVTFSTNAAGVMGEAKVNSYHRFGLNDSLVPSPLSCIAHAPDGSIEAVLGEAPRVLGLMWHPERMAAPEPADLRLIRWLFSHD